MNKRKEAERLAREVLRWHINTAEENASDKIPTEKGKRRVRYECLGFDNQGKSMVHYQWGHPIFTFAPFTDWWSAGLLLEKHGITPEQILREKGLIK